MRTSRKAKDAAAEKRSYICDTFTGHDKAHQPPLPGSPVCVFRWGCSARRARAPQSIWGAAAATMTQSVTALRLVGPSSGLSLFFNPLGCDLGFSCAFCRVSGVSRWVSTASA